MTTESRVSLIAAQGWIVLIAVAVPVLLALIPVASRHHASAQRVRVVAAVLLGIGVMLALASIGMMYLPTLGVLIAAAVSGAEERPSPGRASDTDAQ